MLSVYKELLATKHFDVMDMKTDEDEHSIEMHLPYTAKIMERLIQEPASTIPICFVSQQERPFHNCPCSSGSTEAR